MRRSPWLISAVAVALVLSAVPAALAAGTPNGERTATWAASAGVWTSPDTTLGAGRAASGARGERGADAAASLMPQLPRGRWALSTTLTAQPGATLRVTTGAGTTVARLRTRSDGRLAVRTAGSAAMVTTSGTAHRLEIVSGTPARMAIDGRRLAVGPLRRVRFSATGAGRVRIGSLTVTPARSREALLLHRLADLEARTPPGRFPLGEGDDGRLRFSGGWTSGFWPGALWAADRLVPRGPYGDWALRASLARRGAEDTPIHDVGFMFGHSVVAAYERRCRTAAARASAQCRSLRASALAAADTLVRLAGTTATGLIPTDARGTEARTIVDSLMNLGVLTWATRVSGDRRYAALAASHATRVLGLLQRPDGSTFQVAVHDRATGRLLGLRTSQGLSDTSTWARGQAWAIHGLADAGLALRDRALVAGAERAAAFWMATAPARVLPPYDLSAGRSAPRDSSAAAIAAAGMYALARACRTVSGACTTPGRWTGAARATLDIALSAVSTTPPLGRLGLQAYTVGPRNGAWDDRAELIWGLDFALEAIAERAATGARTS